MRPIGLVGAALLIGVLAVVATAPSSDASAPEWLEPMVDAGRSSLLDNLDLIEPGSPLVLVSAHCRSDGAVRLIYENRWLWVVHRQYFTQAAPGWTSGSMGGGTLHLPDDWLTGHSDSFDVAVSQTELVVDGRRAYRHELERGEGGPEPLALEYLVWLKGGIPCETSSWLVARTESDDPGDHAENRQILDRMIQSLDLDPPHE